MRSACLALRTSRPSQRESPSRGKVPVGRAEHAPRPSVDVPAKSVGESHLLRPFAWRRAREPAMNGGRAERAPRLSAGVPVKSTGSRLLKPNRWPRACRSALRAEDSGEL